MCAVLLSAETARAAAAARFAMADVNATPTSGSSLEWLHNELRARPRPLPAPAGALLSWACARANNSVSDCTQCEWWPQPELLPTAPLPLPPPRTAPETAWFMCLTEPTDATSSTHLDFVRAAVVSARFNAPSLAPHVVWLTAPRTSPAAAANSSSGESSVGGRFLTWLHRARVRVVPHNLSFYGTIPENKQRKPGSGGTGHLNLGAYCRLDVPSIVARLRPELAARGLRRELVLYTDTDVLFAADFRLARRAAAAALPTFYAGTEVFSSAMNSGVMYLNTTTLGRELPAMLRYAVARRFRFLALDQTWLAEWYASEQTLRSKRKGKRSASPGWRSLDDAKYNARAFFHPAPPDGRRSKARRGTGAGAAWAVVQPRIWHWHGYKPQDVACWLEAMRRGSWPARGWCDTKVPCNKGRCRWKPVRDSGCRYFGRIDMRPCYLRTYTYLLTQHHRAVAIADAT